MVDLSDRLSGELNNVAGYISVVMLTGSGLSLAVCVLRITGQVKFTIGQLKLRLANFPYVAAAFTVAHLFLTWVFIQVVGEIRSLSEKASKDAWDSLRSSGGFVFINMRARVWTSYFGRFHIGLYAAQAKDTAYWASVGYALILVAAVTVSLTPDPSVLLTPVASSPKSKFQQILNASAIGSALALLNWVIGTRWAVAASSLLISKQ